ncbi:D-alanyl-D-alanine carboxypeptidase [Alkalibacillus flavidus]|uniref:D-alanyl-D-alanine carboxypeptidase n=1 Tax=Alkalibacillus flavidus TaxID=546021 RepID=A0ABV2KS12_9BACI
MNRAVFVIIVCLVLSSMTMPIHATPVVSAQSAIVMDMETGEVLYEKNGYQSKPIASITKIMTAIVAIEHGELDASVSISTNAANTHGSSIYADAGDHYPLKDLLYGLMLRSGNDAAVAIAEHIAGSEKGFVWLMNEKAEWLGMNDSQFQNPHGLDEEHHYASAHDMAILTQYAMTSNSVFRDIFGTKQYLSSQEDYPWHNKNKLLMTYDDVCTGGKTGYTSTAGRTLVTTAEEDGKELVVVTIDAKQDWQDHRQLYQHGFNQIVDRPEIPISFISASVDETPSYWSTVSRLFHVLQGGT